MPAATRFERADLRASFEADMDGHLRRRRAPLAVLTSFLGVAACGHNVSFTRTAEGRSLQPAGERVVEVKYSNPNGRYREVGLLEVREAEHFSSSATADLIHSLQNRGRQAGCDAIRILGTDEVAGGADLFGNEVGPRRGMTAVCLVAPDVELVDATD